MSLLRQAARLGGGAAAAAVLFLGGCAHPPVPAATAPQRPPAPSWAMEGGDPGRASRVPDGAPREWSAREVIFTREGAGYRPEEYASPVVIAGIAYFGHSGRSFDAYRLDGTRVWSVATPGRVYATAAYGDGLLIFGDDQGTVRALDLDGREAWSFSAAYPVVCSALVVGGRVYVAVADQNVFCLEAATGRPLWQYGRKFPRRNALWRSLGLAYGDGRVYAGFADGTVVALEADLGRVVWRAELGQADLFGDVTAGPSFRDGRVYAGAFRGPAVCLDAASGEELWRRPVEAAAGFAVGDDRLFLGTADGRVLALSRDDGSTLWAAELDGGAVTPPLLAGNTVLAGASEGSLFGFDAATGQVRGRYTPGPGLHAQPMAFEGGTLFLSDGGAVHVLR